MSWLADNWNTVLTLTWRSLYLAGIPLVLGFVVSIPLGWLASRWSRTYPAIITTTGLLYTIPSLAMFVMMPVLLGTKILDPVNVIVAMTIYTVALLARTVADGLNAVPDDIAQAATAMGYKGVRRLFGVELPLAAPVVAAGLRVAAVSNVSIVSVATLIGVSQLGDLLVDGYNRVIWGELLSGIIACVLLALAFDAVIVLGTRAVTPWLRVQAARA
ncbi:MAG TPA: ABC transporter permease [Ornithinibacter sp.]|nr:ABC transporter permease [Ornithinibacter sp.]